MEWTSFTYETGPFHSISVNAGQTMFHRKSSESSVTIPDRETTKTLVAKVENAINGRASLTVNKVTHANYSLSLRQDVRHCGYPDRLLLPKGKKGGLPFTLYAILTDYNKEKHDTSCDPFYLVAHVVLAVAAQSAAPAGRRKIGKEEHRCLAPCSVHAVDRMGNVVAAAAVHG
uniref:Hemocyanin C-terminal domain-containing protein n=1 Tax=Timema bartmani TaxID=61472 RepID=A0A7R9F3G7_9NEOP|nr:unnamed protein product [Timema bartmani]